MFHAQKYHSVNSKYHPPVDILFSDYNFLPDLNVTCICNIFLMFFFFLQVYDPLGPQDDWRTVEFGVSGANPELPWATAPEDMGGGAWRGGSSEHGNQAWLQCISAASENTEVSCILIVDFGGMPLLNYLLIHRYWPLFYVICYSFQDRGKRLKVQQFIVRNANSLFDLSFTEGHSEARKLPGEEGEWSHLLFLNVCLWF